MLPLLLLLAPPPTALAGHEFLVTTVRTGDTEIARVDPATGDVRNLSRSPASEDRYPCWSPDGQQVAFTSDRDGLPFQLYVMAADGSNVRRLGKLPGTCYMPSWRAGRIAFGLHGDKPLIATVSPDGGDLRLLGEGHDPCLSPDGRQIAFTGHLPGGVSVFVMNSDGTGRRCLVPEANPVGAVFPDWSPDGKRLVFSKPVGTAHELFVVNADGTGLRQLTRTGAVCTPAAWSPDGAWVNFRRTDERYWSDPVKVKAVYADRPADKRPVWVVRPDGRDAHVVECLRFQCAMDGSRAAWRPRP